MSITEKELQKKIRETEGRAVIADSDGLALDVMNSGRKVWRVRFTADGKRYMKTLGEYPLLSLKEARLKRDEIKVSISSGENPVRPKPNRLTLKEVFEEFMRERQEGTYTQKYCYNTRQRMKEVIKLYGENYIDSITSADILSILTNTQKAGHIDKAFRIRQVCGQVFRYGISQLYLDNDPTYALRCAVKSREVTHMARPEKEDRIGELMEAIRDKGSSPTMRAMLSLHAYTFVRPKEIREAEWTEFDIKNALWKIPSEKMKMRREHIVPLAEQALDILARLNVITGHGRYLFPAATAWAGDRHISDNAENKALRERNFTREEIVGHGFRGIASTILHEAGWDSLIIEIQLSHVDENSTRLAYNGAKYMQQRRRMMQWYADYLDSLRDKKDKPEMPM